MEVEKTKKVAMNSAEFEPFSVREFRKKLWNDAEVISAMQLFVKRSRNRVREDVALEFLKESASSDSMDLTRLLGEKLPSNQVVVIFNCLEAIFLRISDGLQSQYDSWTEMVIGQLLQRGPIHNFVRALTPTNSAATIVSALRLLTTMVTMSSSSAKTIMASIKISSDHLRALLERSSGSMLLGESVRSATIVYLMSFLMIDDISLTRQLVDENGPLDAIFPGLAADNAPTIELFLTTLLSKVVENSSIMKTSKCHLFNFKNLKTLVKLFEWKSNNPKTKVKKHSLSQAEEEAIRISNTKEDHTEKESLVRRITLHFLKSVCCSTDHGVLFTDAACGTTGVNKNIAITKLLSEHCNPYDDPFVVDLFVSILSASPDQLVHYLPRIHSKLAVRASEAWIRIMSFVRKIFEVQRPMEVLRLAEQKIEHNEELVQIALLVTTTSMLNKEYVNKILTHEELAVRHQGLLFLATILEKARNLLDVNSSEFRTLFVKDQDIRKFVKLYTAQFLNKLPSWHLLVKCWDKVFSAINSGDNKTSTTPQLLSQTSVADHVRAIVNTVDLYFGVDELVSLDRQVDFLTRNLLANFTIFENKLDNQDASNEIQLTTLKLLSDSNKFGQLVLSKTVANKSVVSIVCETAGRQDDHLHRSVRTASVDLLKKLLFSTKIFRGVEHEIDLWTRDFDKLDSNHETVKMTVAFLSDLIDDLIRDEDLLRNDLKRRRFDQHGSKKSKLLMGDSDDRYDQLFNDILNDEYEGKIDEPTKIDNQVEDEIEFSPMVLAALRRLDSMSSSSSAATAAVANFNRCQKFVSRILVDVLHCQHHPRILCDLMTQQFGHVLSKKCVKYVALFDSDVVSITRPTSFVKRSEAMPSVKDLSALVKEAFKARLAPITLWNGEILVDLLAGTKSSSMTCRQLLVYLQVLVRESFSLELISFFCDVLNTVVTALSENEAQKTVANLILKHPVVTNSFLNDDMLTANHHAAKCEVLTELALKTVSNVYATTRPNSGHNHHLMDVGIFVQKVQSFIVTKFDHFISKSSSGSCGSKMSISFVDLLTPFRDKLTASNLRDLVTHLLSSQLTALDLLKAHKKSLNDVGSLLALIVDIVARRSDLIFTASHVAILTGLHKEIVMLRPRPNVEETTKVYIGFGNKLFLLFKNSPVYVLAVDADFLVFCLENQLHPVHIELADVLIRCNICNYPVLEDWLMSNSHKWRDQPATYARVVDRYLKQYGLIENRANIEQDRKKDILIKLSKTYWTTGIEGLLQNDETAASIVESLVRLETISSKRRTNFCNRVAESSESGNNSLSVRSLEAFRVVLSTLSKDDLNDVGPSVFFVKVCFQTMMQKNKALSNDWNQQDGGLLEMIKKTLKGSESLSGLRKCLHEESKLLKSVIKASLKAGLRDPAANDAEDADDGGKAPLEFLKTLFESFQSNAELDHRQSTLVYEMIFGHSNFLPRILQGSSTTITSATRPTTVSHYNWKIALLDLLIFLIEANSSVCKAVHVPVFLAAYEGFLRPTDERLLRLLYLYEANGVDMHSYRPFVWGRTAAHHYSVLKHLGSSLWKQPKMEEVLGLFDKDVMLRTALHFPLDIDLQVQSYASGNRVLTLSGTNRKDLIYDPRFLLPLFSHLLSPEALVHCTSFIDCNGLAIAFASLSSYSKSTRSTGCYILSCFRDHLEGRKSRNTLIWIYLLDLVRNSLESGGSSGDPSAKAIPPTMAVFLTRTCQLLQDPSSLVAQPVFNYLFVRPYLDLMTVPEFYVLFSNPDANHNATRLWILDVLSDGLRTETDFKLCQKRHVFKIVLSFFESPLSNLSCKSKILTVLKAASRIPSVAEHFVNRQGILAFLVSALRDFGDGNKEIVTDIVGVVSSAWTSVSKTTMINVQGVSIVVWTEFLLVLGRILDCLNASATTISTFRDFSKVFASVLTHWSPNTFNVSSRGQNSPGVTTNSLKNLLDTYESIVADRRCDVQLQLDEDRVAIEEVRMAICDILMSWRAEIVSRTANYVSVFSSSLYLLLKLFSKNYEKLIRIYSWLSEHLGHDSAGSLTKHLATTSHGLQILSLLFKSYEHLLIEAGDVDDVKKHVASADVLATLNASIVAIARTWNRIKTVVHPVGLVNPFLERLDRIWELSREPELEEAINLMASGDAHQRRFSAISLAVLVCELCIHKNDPKHFRTFLQSATENSDVIKEKGYDVITSAEIVSSSERSSTKRKADESTTPVVIFSEKKQRKS